MFTSGEGAAAAALRNAIKIERLEDPITPVGEILKRVPLKQLMEVYKIGTFAGVDQFLQLIANARGKLKKGGVVDTEVSTVGACWHSAYSPFIIQPVLLAEIGSSQHQLSPVPGTVLAVQCLARLYVCSSLE